MVDVSDMEVDYFKYCPICVNIKKRCSEEPCNSCLSNTYAYGTEKPHFFEKDEKSSE